MLVRTPGLERRKVEIEQLSPGGIGGDEDAILTASTLPRKPASMR
jgi:hypothetical protein